MRYNGWVYEKFGISKRFLIKPLQSLLNVLTLKLALSAKCFIYRVELNPLRRIAFSKLPDSSHI